MMQKTIKTVFVVVIYLAVLCGGRCNLPHHISMNAIAETNEKGVEAVARIETWFNQDLTQPVKVHYLDGNVFSQDNNGNVIGVNVFNNGETASLAGNVSGHVIRSDGGTVVIESGTLSGNKVSVVLPQAAYAVPGVISIIIKLTNGSDITTLCAVVANVYQSSTNTAIDPGTVIPSIETLIAEIDAAVASIPADYSSLWTSLAPAFTAGSYTTGQYVTYDGKVYRFTGNHSGSWTGTDVTAVNLGNEIYQTKQSIATVSTDLAQTKQTIYTTPTLTSGGFVKPYFPGDIATHARSSYSDYIPFTGDALVYTYLLENSTGLCVYDENKNFIKAYTGDGAAWYKVSVDNGRYFRFTNDHVSMSDSNVKYMLVIGGALADRVDMLTLFTYAPTLTSGGYIIPWSGQIAEHARSSYSDFIPFVGNVRVYTYLIDGTSIGVYDKDRTFIRGITGSGAKWYDITTEGGAYYRLTNDHVSMDDVYVRCIYGDMNPFVTPPLTSGGYVIPWSPGAIAEHVRSSYSDYIAFNGKGNVFTYLIDGTGIDVYDSGKTFIRAITGSGAKWYDITTEGGKYFRLSNDHISMDDSKVLYSIADMDEHNYLVPNLLSVNQKIVCCGDSLTWGQVYTGASASRQAYHPYPNILETLTGVTCQNIGAAGYSTGDWYSHYSNQLNQDALYIIFLGTNGGMTDTISTDCSGTDPAQFADTNTGNYGKILQTLKNNGKKAVLIHVYAAGTGDVATTNSVINQFGQRFSYPVIELGSERVSAIYHYYPDGTGSNSVHFNDYGYCWMANEINDLINGLPNADKQKIFPD